VSVPVYDLRVVVDAALIVTATNRRERADSPTHSDASVGGVDHVRINVNCDNRRIVYGHGHDPDPGAETETQTETDAFRCRARRDARGALFSSAWLEYQRECEF
jgi:hypothetical protein